MEMTTMRSHAVETATTLYEAGTLTLEQAAGQAGLSPEAMAVRVGRRDVDAPDDLEPGDSPVAAD
jgi:predicted HTH domain antitoxin